MWESAQSNEFNVSRRNAGVARMPGPFFIIRPDKCLFHLGPEVIVDLESHVSSVWGEVPPMVEDANETAIDFHEPVIRPIVHRPPARGSSWSPLRIGRRQRCS